MQEQDLRIRKVVSTIRHKYLRMSGKGGVGKTTIAVNLAVVLSEKGYSVGLLDVDIHGPNVLEMLGLEGEHLTGTEGKMIPLSMPIAGIIENMSGLVCPFCGKKIELFKSGRGRTVALEMNVEFLGAWRFRNSVCSYSCFKRYIERV